MTQVAVAIFMLLIQVTQASSAQIKLYQLCKDSENFAWLI